MEVGKMEYWGRRVLRRVKPLKALRSMNDKMSCVDQFRHGAFFIPINHGTNKKSSTDVCQGLYRAEDGTRTRDPNLGKVML
ncbi:MAG: hypothetical protein Q4A53_03115, partial [Porphyromonas sp.]|nr:hypothetical protein [Porphyromonas sp.]